MRVLDFLCLNGTEVAYAGRTLAYIRNGLIETGNWSADADCGTCDIIDDNQEYVSPAVDDAPWFDSDRPASEEFFGIIPRRIEDIATIGRSVANKANGGGIVGPSRPKPRVLNFTGELISSSLAGMTWGARWLREVLSGSACLDGCSTDEALILPACPGSEYVDYADEALYFRRLLDVGLVDGPVFGQVNDLPECHIAGVTFQLAAGQPYLFSPEITCADEVAVSTDSESPTCCLIETNDWPGDAVAVITVRALDDNVTDVRLSGKPTFDSQCPVIEAEACWELTIPSLPQDAVLIIDSARQAIYYTDPSRKVQYSGIHMVKWEGPLTYPEISPCSEFCVCAWAATGSAVITVEKVIREL